MSTLKVTNIAGLTGSSTSVIDGLAKHWGNVDGNSGTPSVQDSFNNSSMTDNGAGLYQYNFTNNMNNASYSAQVTSKPHSTSGVVTLSTLDYYFNTTNPLSTSNVRTKHGGTGGTNNSRDVSIVCCTSHGDLA